MRLVQKRLSETEAVSGLLSEIFKAEDEVIMPSTVTPPTQQSILGLDGSHSALLAALVIKESWPKHEVEKLAKEYLLLTDGAILTINEAALETVDDVIIDGDDPFTINKALIEEHLQ